MTLKQHNKLLSEELQKARDKVVNLSTDLQKEQQKRFDLIQDTNQLKISKQENVRLQDELLKEKDSHDLTSKRYDSATQHIETLRTKIVNNNAILSEFNRLKRKEEGKRWEQ